MRRYMEGYQKMTEIEFLYKQYEMLVELSQYHHSRWNNHMKVFLTFIGLVAAGIATIVGSSKPSEHVFLVQCLSIIGLVVCVLCVISINRIRNDEILKFAQINRVEERIARYAEQQGFLFVSQSREAVVFFSGGEVEGKTFGPRIFGRSCNNMFIVFVVFALFALYFVGGLIGVFIR